MPATFTPATVCHNRRRQMASQIQVGKPGLLRQLGFVSATALVISNMVGTGIFATTGFMAGDLGDPDAHPGALGGGRAVRAGRRAQLLRARHQFPQFRRRICLPDARLRTDLGIHDRLGLVLRRLLRAHRRRRAGLLGLPGLLLPRPASSRPSHTIGSGFFSADARRRASWWPACWCSASPS